MTSAAPTLTLQDIADLARVRRPVVSMWRNRPWVRGQFIPFPEPIDASNGVERFSRDLVVEWLEQTGRGNNAEANLDAPALSVPEGEALEDLVTLLCLQATTGEELAETTAEQRTALARMVDPRDQFLLREVTTAEPTVDTLRFIDDLAEASYGPGEALARLERGRVARELGVRGLTTDAVNLVRAVADACARHADPEEALLVHVGGAATLTLALTDQFSHLVVSGDDPERRALRRRASIRAIETTVEATSPSVRVLSVVGDQPKDALDAIDDMVIGLSERDLAVVLGSAGILCDELRGDHEQNRAQTLRSGNLVVALRLPRGMWREAHRQALGLWICAGGVSTRQPLVADLAGFARRELDEGDLAADVAGALDGVGARAFRYLRPHDLPQILSSRAVVVPRGVRAIQLATTDVERYLTRISAATLQTSEPIPVLDVLAEAAPRSMLLHRRSLGELKDLGQVRVTRGSRIDRDHADPAGSVMVFSVTNTTETIALDPFDAARHYPRAARTEPGDVVFVERPRPTARVDDYGGSLVASPSKILRVGPHAGVGPQAVAAIINRLPDEATEWQTWCVPILDPTAAEQLENALTVAAGYESSLRRHLDAVRNLVASMIDGVAAGAVTLKT